MSELLFRKEVDQSLLKAGTTIPQDVQDKLQQVLGIILKKGEKVSVSIRVEDEQYEATLTNIDFSEKYSNRTVLQLRYSEGSPLCQRLKQIYSTGLIDDTSGRKAFLEVYALDKHVLMFKTLPLPKKQEKVSENEDIMKAVIDKVLNEYASAKKETFAGHPIGSFFRNDIPRKLYETGIVDSNKYLVTGSVGQGNWANVPWICIFDRNVTTSATKGVYIVYLLSKDGQTLYLTFNQGCTELRNNHNKRETIRLMREKAEDIVGRINGRGFKTDERINLGNGLTELAELYQKGTIFYTSYKCGSVPAENILREDLSKMMMIYSDYVNGVDSRDQSIDVNGQQKTWLLSWNPNNWNWEDYDKAVKLTHTNESYDSIWSCANTHVSIGDRVFLVMLGMGDANGILASGIATSESFEADHWDVQKQAQGIKAKRINVKFDWILDYRKDKIIKQSQLCEMFPNQQWSPQGSGIEIKEEYTEGLEILWRAIRDNSDNTRGEEEVPASIKETIDHIKTYIAAKGFSYNEGLIENFYLSLKSKPFVILAGTSGTGKTRLVRLFAEAISAEYQLVAVRPDWSDSSDLFGHVDLNGNFIPGAVLDFINRAKANPEKPYILCLDEMNLARVEYYLSDILSIMETREVKDGIITSDPVLNESYYGKKDIAAREKYGVQRIPENFYIVGTVNMDETTFPFSRKVLDRANTIEFSYVDLDNPEFGDSAKPDPEKLSNSFLKTEYLFLKQCVAEEEYVKAVCADLQRINSILQKAEAHVGYRVRDEIVFYMLNNKKAGLLSEKEAFDNEIMQKILPRIQGSSASVKKLLCSLFVECAGSYSDSNDSDSKNMEKYLEEKRGTLPYPKSAEKIMFMTRRFEEDGFTSYWL